MPDAFPADILAAFDRTGEIDIETSAGPGAPVHRATIWIVVDGGDVLVRSVNGTTARWYREAIAVGGAAIIVGAERVEVRIERAADPESIRRMSEAMLRKYQGSVGVAEMLVQEILASTLRLSPVPDA